MIIRDYGNGFKVTDLTEELVSIPNEYGLINQLGIFDVEPVSQHTVTFEASDRVIGLIGDKVRGERNNVSKDGKRVMRSYAIPHFPLDDYITPQDVQGQRAYGEEGVERKEAVQMRKLETIRKSHAITLETARAKMITSGDIYAPNGTVVGNVYTDFDVTRKQVAMDLTNAATDILGKQREIVDHIQDNIMSGETPSEIIALCSPSYFDAYISQAGVKEAYKFYTSTQEPLRNGNWSQFRHGDITLIRYNGKFKDASGVSQALIPDGDAYYLPLDTSDSFKTYFSPANKFDLANTLGEQAYVFVYEDGKGSKIEIESEANLLNLMKRPQVVVRAVKGATV
jgi:hypothetical protein